MGKTNKYGAIKTEYNGDVFDSKKEAAYASILDILKKSTSTKDKVISYRRQVPFPILVNLEKICNYILDFQIVYADGRIEHVDIKGYKKGAAYAMFRIKKKLVEVIYKIEILEK